MAAHLFYVVRGSHLLVGDDVMQPALVDVVMIPPGTSHAFAATRDATPSCSPSSPPARHGSTSSAASPARVASGQEPPGPFVADQASFDVHLDDSPAWHKARAEG